MPLPARSSFRLKKEKLVQNEILLVKQQLARNREKLFKAVRADPNTKWIQIDGLEVPLLEVEVDGSWKKQGFTSDYGITVVVSCLTGDVLDYHVMSKYCNNCISKVFR